MPFEIAWRPPNGLIKRHFDHVTGQEVLAANVQAEADPRFDSLLYVVNDFSDCTGVSVSPEEIVEIAAIDHAASESNPYIRIAIVVTLPEVVAAANAYATDALSPFTTRLFSSRDAAWAWLGVSAA